MRRGLVSAGVAVVLLSSMSLSAVSASQAVTPRCFGMAATIVGTEASETIRGTPGDDVIVGGGGAAPDYPGDKIYGRGGDDRICVRIRDESFTIVRGGLGDDQLQSSFYMFGGPGNDTLTEPARLALVIWVVGGRGDDVMRSRVTSTTYFVPGSGDDTLMGAVGSYISNVAIFRGAHRGLVLDQGEGRWSARVMTSCTASTMCTARNTPTSSSAMRQATTCLGRAVPMCFSVGAASTSW